MNARKNLAADAEQGPPGKKYWRSLEELAQTPAFQELMQREFPEQAALWPDALSRRNFLTLMGASLSLAGLGCSIRPAPSVHLVPYVKAPEEVIPGQPLFYATTMNLAGAGVGVLVESHLGRPTKIEGNPEHPASLGGTDVFLQASVLSLYDPDRSQTVTHLGQTTTWDHALRDIRKSLQEQFGSQGAGVRILTETVVSPTLGQQLTAFLNLFPQARWHQYEPLARDAAHQGAQLAFGKAVNVYPDFTAADVVVSLDHDFLAGGPGHLAHVADFSDRRRVRTSAAAAGQARMSRLYAVETALTLTGAKADARLALPAGEIAGVARAVWDAVTRKSTVEGEWGQWVNAAARDLLGHRGRCVVLAGERQPPAVHLLAHALNDHLGNVGHTVLHAPPIEARPMNHAQSLGELAEDLDSGHVELLLILGGNPVYNAPADLRFAEHLQKAAVRVHLSSHQDETSRLCHWHLPETHYLEAWSDTRAYDGTAAIAQPLIEPLYQGRSPHEVLAALTPRQGSTSTDVSYDSRPGYEVVRDYWRTHWENRKQLSDQGPRRRPRQQGERREKWLPENTSFDNFEDFWETALHDGFVHGTTFKPQAVPLRAGWEERLPAASPPATREEGAYEIAFQADPAVLDGRFANNGWLQEFPKPVTRLTWGNAILVSPATAKQLKVGLGDYAHGGEHGGFYQPVVAVHLGDRVLEAPVWIEPGHADGAVTVHLGYGREHAGRLGTGVGANAYPLRTSSRPWFAPGATVQVTTRQEILACVQAHHLMENREVVRAATLEDYRKHPTFAADKEEAETKVETQRARVPLTLYDPFTYKVRRWGMSIDLTACVGCGACVVACQAENNIPVVGKEQVAAGREMHWLRVDHYKAGPADSPTEFYFQPVPCMHCENAPCEYVCPVEATAHSAEGLNDMVYQRCVGTRFCSNNCPYKVRRFNFLEYGDFNTPSRRLQYNPDVTVRSRGVMEKCSYCVQRIRAAEIDAQKEKRPIFDGEILTACQAACPAQAITFGDIEDKKSKVRAWKELPLHYALLADLNTEPRTTYLAALRNPTPEPEH